MKYEKTKSITIILILLTMVIFVSNSFTLPENGKNKFHEGYYSETLTEMSPIIIKSNTELQDFAASNGIQGQGSKADPYVFENFFFKEFNSTEGAAILLENTDLFVIIRNNSFSMIEGPLISLNLVSNISIQNNYFDTYAKGIYINAGENINITRNAFTRVSEGIEDRNSKNINILENTFEFVFEGVRGIESFFSDNVSIVGNKLTHRAVRDYSYEEAISGIGIYTYITNSLISDNEIQDFQIGAVIGSSENTTIENNTLTNSGFQFDLQPQEYGQLTFSNNSINGKKILVTYNVNNTSFDLSEVSQAFFISTNNITAFDFFAEDYYSSALTVENSNNLYFSNITINNQISSESGVFVSSSSNITFEDAFIQNDGKGIQSMQTSQLNVLHSTFVNNSYGIYLYLSDSANITRNNFNSQQIAGIYSSASDNVVFLSNFFGNSPGSGMMLSTTNVIQALNNYFESTGIDLKITNYFNHPIIFDNFQNNTIDGKPIYYYQDTRGIDVNSVSLGQLLLVNTSSVKISNSNILGGGIRAWYSDNVTVENTFISNSTDGIHLYYSDNWVMNSVQVSSSREYGLYVDRSNNGTLYQSVIRDSKNGVLLQIAHNFTISQNSFSGIEGVSIQLQSANYEILSNNEFNKTGADIKVISSVATNVSNNIMYSGIDVSQLSFSTNLGTVFEAFSNNSIFGKSVVLLKNQNTVATVISDVAQVLLYNSTFVTIQDSAISANYGIQTFASSRITIQNVNFTSQDMGIFSSSTNNLTIESNKFTNTDYPIYLSSSSNITISENNIVESTSGILSLGLAKNITISKNYIEASSTPVQMIFGSNAVITENTFVNGTNGVIVSIQKGSILNNQFINTGLKFPTALVGNDYSTLQIENNTVNGFPMLFYYNKTDVSVEDTRIGQLIAISVSNVYLRNVSFVNTFSPVSVFLSENITILDSEFINASGTTMFLYKSVNAEIKNNGFTNAEQSFYAQSSENITLIDNSMEEFTGYGIYLDKTTDSRIQNNLFVNSTDSDIAMALDSGKNNVFYNNTWNDWSQPDANNDGIVDIPYKLDGYDENHDYRPLVYVEPTPPTSTPTSTDTGSDTSDTATQPENPTNSTEPPENPSEPANDNWLLIIIGISTVVVAVGAVVFFKYRHKFRKMRKPSN